MSLSQQNLPARTSLGCLCILFFFFNIFLDNALVLLLLWLIFWLLSLFLLYLLLATFLFLLYLFVLFFFSILSFPLPPSFSFLSLHNFFLYITLHILFFFFTIFLFLLSTYFLLSRFSFQNLFSARFLVFSLLFLNYTWHFIKHWVCVRHCSENSMRIFCFVF